MKYHDTETKIGNKINNKLKMLEPDQIKISKQFKDKSDFSTRDKVLDKKTLLILEKLQKRNILFDLEGCISSGKEANIYKAKLKGPVKCDFLKKIDSKNNQTNIGSIDSTNSTNTLNAQYVENSYKNVVIKIFRTSILEFKNRSIYIFSDPRFKKFKKSSSRELIKNWAEKEVRNLTRLYNSNILTAKPFYLRRNIIIMEMIGNDQTIAIKLKDFVNKLIIDQTIDDEDKITTLNDLYNQILSLIYRMYKSAKIVHCDLSEYNLLIHEKKVYVIDVGQSVDITHSYSDLFLLNDINNLNMFFERRNVQIKDHVQIYEWVTGKTMDFEWRNLDINKIGYEIEQKIVEKVNCKVENVTEENSINEKSEKIDENKIINEKYEKNINQFIKNKNMRKKDKLERRKQFKLERKIKRMTREKKVKPVYKRNRNRRTRK